MREEILSVAGLFVNAGKKPLLRDVSFSVSEQDFFMIAGPNGAGKTTIIRAICGETDYLGSITYRGVPLRKLSAREFAKKIGVLNQKSLPSYAYTVREVVELGRYAYTKGLIPHLSAADNQAIESALIQTQLTGFEQRNIMTLSGGEYQRVLLAKLIAQDPEILILDEPANHLDFTNQLKLFELLKEWIKQSKKAVIAVVHDFNLIKSYGTHGVLLKAAQLAACGTVDEILDGQILKEVFETDISQWMRARLKEWTQD